MTPDGEFPAYHTLFKNGTAVARAVAEHDSALLVQQHNDFSGIVSALNSHAAASEKIRVLREAMNFYADPRKYKGPNQQAEPDEEEVPGGYRVDVTRDQGQKARAALEQTKP